MSKKTLFPNLEAEQTRLSLNDEEVSKKLQISRTSYNLKKKKGNFKLNEIVKLCHIFDKDFGYLFHMESEAV